MKTKEEIQNEINLINKILDESKSYDNGHDLRIKLGALKWVII